MKKGQVIVIAVFVLVIVSLLGMIAVSIFSGESVSTIRNLQGIKALNVAEGGMRFTMAASLAADTNWSNNVGFGPVSLGGGTFSVTYLGNPVQRACTIEVTGTVQGVSRVIRTRFRKSATGMSSLPDNFDYSMFISSPSGGAPLNINGDARVYGDFFYYGAIAMGGSAQQTGGTIYSTSITKSGTANYASWEAIPDLTMPTWSNSYYDIITREALTSAGSTLTLGWGQTLNLNNQTLYYQNVTLDWGSTVVGPGTLCATGRPSGNGDIIVNYGQGVGANVRFIAARDFIYQGGSSFVNTFEAYVNRHLQLVSNLSVPHSILYSAYNGSDAIVIDPAQVDQSVILCPYGEFSFGGGQQIEGLIYANSINNSSSGTIRGALVAYSASTLGGSLHLYFDGSVLPEAVVGLTSGASSGSAEFEATDWQLVF